MPQAYETHMDPLVALTFAASHTTRVQLGTSTLNGLWQPPILLTRSLNTLDLLSRGRPVVGLGLGRMPDESTAVSVRLRRIGRRFGGRLPVAMPLPHLMGMGDIILKKAVEAGWDPSAPCMALRVNPRLTDTRTDPERLPRAGALAQYVDDARAAAEAGVHELFVTFGQMPATLAERVDLAGRFLEGVRRG